MVNDGDPRTVRLNSGPPTPWHSLPAAECARRLKTSLLVGLPSEEAERRLAREGPNVIPAERTRSFGALFLKWLGRPVALTTLAALGIAASFGWRAELAVIGAAVLYKVAVLAALETWATRAIESHRRLGALAVRGHLRCGKAGEGAEGA